MQIYALSRTSATIRPNKQTRSAGTCAMLLWRNSLRCLNPFGWICRRRGGAQGRRIKIRNDLGAVKCLLKKTIYVNLDDLREVEHCLIDNITLLDIFNFPAKVYLITHNTAGRIASREVREARQACLCALGALCGRLG